jgi:hypothetical protein
VGRVPSGQSYQIKHLNERHQEIARRVVLGEKPADIAADLGISRELVSVVKGSELGAAYIRELEAERNAYTVDISIQLKDLCPAAMDVLKDGVEGRLGGNAKDYVRMKAATEILDRAGYGKIHSLKAEVNHGFLTPDNFERIKQRAREMNEEAERERIARLESIEVL